MRSRRPWPASWRRRKSRACRGGGVGTCTHTRPPPAGRVTSTAGLRNTRSGTQQQGRHAVHWVYSAAAPIPWCAIIVLDVARWLQQPGRRVECPPTHGAGEATARQPTVTHSQHHNVQGTRTSTLAQHPSCCYGVVRGAKHNHDGRGGCGRGAIAVGRQSRQRVYPAAAVGGGGAGWWCTCAPTTVRGRGSGIGARGWVRRCRARARASAAD